MIHCLRERLALLASGASGTLVLIKNHLPATWGDWASVAAIVAGICGATLSVQQIYYNWSRRRERRKKMKS